MAKVKVIFPTHIQTFMENREEVKRLVNIHIQVLDTKATRRKDLQVLHKSAIVLLVACWETFIESIVSQAFEFMLHNAKTHNVFPTSVLVKVSKELKEDKDERNIWSIAGVGWIEVLTKYKIKHLKKEVDHFHVPRPSNIDHLFSNLIGIENLSKKWSWKGQTNVETIQSLEALINLRGSIAHKIQIDETISRKDVLYYLNFVNNLTVSTNNIVSKYIEQRVGSRPWDTFTYKVRKKL